MERVFKTTESQLESRNIGMKFNSDLQKDFACKVDECELDDSQFVLNVTLITTRNKMSEKDIKVQKSTCLLSKNLKV